ncbi:hypothetical protein CYMTET_56614 [Cymbomonas tetramitiformis]|uniref:Uncharacterized protein n=1 Tax=Cymbomonas tetramitiformis TaxID=36881 RepID=A0AAE0BAI9_9CHLO|nr:hypothetical protein CYMTET_56614 [Cymbomonas tetramitiformis]
MGVQLRSVPPERDKGGPGSVAGVLGLSGFVGCGVAVAAGMESSGGGIVHWNGGGLGGGVAAVVAARAMVVVAAAAEAAEALVDIEVVGGQGEGAFDHRQAVGGGGNRHPADVAMTHHGKGTARTGGTRGAFPSGAVRLMRPPAVDASHWLLHGASFGSRSWTSKSGGGLASAS